MDKQKAGIFHKELNEVLVALAAKHGMSFKPANATFSSTDFKSRVEFTDLTASGEVQHGTARERAIYNLEAEFNKKIPKLDSIVSIQGKKFKIDGLTSFRCLLVTNVATGKPAKYNQRGTQAFLDGFLVDRSGPIVGQAS